MRINRLYPTPPHLKTVRGFSLVELMVSITIGLFLLLGLATLLASSSKSNQELQKSSAQIENGRYAVQLLSDDIKLAGFYGEYSPGSGATYTLPADPCATAVASLGWSYDSITNTAQLPTAIYGYSGAAAWPATCTTALPELANRKPGTAILVLRRVQTKTAATATAGTAYLQVSLCDQETTPFVLSATLADFTLKQKDCGTAAVKRKYVQHMYYISSCNVCGAGGDTIPTLKMVEFVAGAQTIVPLVEGIEDMQFDYGVDYLPAPTTTTTADGSPDCTISNPSATDVAAAPLSTEVAGCPAGTWTSAASNWANVMTVRMHVLARNTQSTPGYSDNRTYGMGLATASTPAARSAIDPNLNQYKRHVYSTLVRATNVSGRREPS